MLSKDESDRIAIFKQAATLNQAQIAEYFDLLKKEEEPEIVVVKKGRKKKK